MSGEAVPRMAPEAYAREHLHSFASQLTDGQEEYRDAAAKVASRLDPFATTGVLSEVWRERERQHARWGEQNHPDGTGYGYLRERAEIAKRECKAAGESGRDTWRLILREEYREALAESDPAALRAELVQVAAVAVAWVEAIDRRKRDTA